MSGNLDVDHPRRSDRSMERTTSSNCQPKFTARVRATSFGLNEILERGLFEQHDVHIHYVSSLEGKGDLSDYEALIRQRLQLRLPAEVGGRAFFDRASSRRFGDTFGWSRNARFRQFRATA